MDRRECGRRGEAAVARRLVALGFRILARNVRLGRGEIDLVVARGAVWWFVECKARGRADVGSPLRAVDRRKRAALFAAARAYVVRNGFRGDWGFLAAAVILADGAAPDIRFERLAIGPSACDDRA